MNLSTSNALWIGYVIGVVALIAAGLLGAHIAAVVAIAWGVGVPAAILILGDRFG